MRVLVACEYSGRTRDAFTRHGHEAMSCDLLPTESPGEHYQGDARDLNLNDFDLVVAHPPCTYISRVSLQWLQSQHGRHALALHAVEFFKYFWQSDVPHLAIENPKPARVLTDAVGQPSQTVHPFYFGSDWRKETCLWLRGLPLLGRTSSKTFSQAKEFVESRSAGPDRWKERSTTFTELAEAYASQWSQPKDYQQCLL